MFVTKQGPNVLGSKVDIDICCQFARYMQRNKYVVQVARGGKTYLFNTELCKSMFFATDRKSVV